MLCLNYCIFSGSEESLVRCGGKLQHLLIAYFLVNKFAKHYENPTTLSRVTAKNVGDVFETHCSLIMSQPVHYKRSRSKGQGSMSQRNVRKNTISQERIEITDFKLSMGIVIKREK